MLSSVFLHSARTRLMMIIICSIKPNQLRASNPPTPTPRKTLHFSAFLSSCKNGVVGVVTNLFKSNWNYVNSHCTTSWNRFHSADYYRHHHRPLNSHRQSIQANWGMPSAVPLPWHPPPPLAVATGTNYFNKTPSWIIERT